MTIIALCAYLAAAVAGFGWFVAWRRNRKLLKRWYEGFDSFKKRLIQDNADREARDAAAILAKTKEVETLKDRLSEARNALQPLTLQFEECKRKRIEAGAEYTKLALEHNRLKAGVKPAKAGKKVKAK